MRCKQRNEGFPIGQGSLEVELQSGKKILTDFAITSIGQTRQSALLATLAPEAIKPNGFIATLPTLQIADHASSNVFALGGIADTGANKAARPDPWCEVKDGGILDMGVEGWWTEMGAPLHDYTLE